MKVLVWIFSAQYERGKKLQKVGRNFTFSVEDSLGLHKISEKFSEIAFPQILGKNLDRIWDKTWQISGQTDEYSPTKKIKQFHT